jgi:DtxR family Mn-dependent transcriptional regulator
MATITVENYVKRIFLEQQREPESLVSLGALAAAMNVVPGTVTTMVKGLADSGLLRYEPRHGVKLTRNGEKLALTILRRHRLIELFLVNVLNVDWSEVHAEAEELEHSLSDKLLQRIDDYLGNPQFDPHGDPIPTRSGKLLKRQLRPLASCTPGEKATVAVIADQAPEFLTYARLHGLTPGANVIVKSADPIADSITLSNPSGKLLTLGGAAAAKIFVK